MYGSIENPFIVNNMSKETGLKLGKKFGQESIIYGERTENGMTFQLITSSNCNGESQIGDVQSERKVFINRDNSDDYYTEVKGRKFQIPFFDVEDDNGIIRYGDSVWDGGRIVRTGSSVKPETISPEDREKIDRLVSESLKENKIERYGWQCRGLIGNILNKYL
jgi:hypothetical protein